LNLVWHNNTAKIQSVLDSHSLSYFCDEFKGINYA